MEKVEVSVIIPAYNEEDNLKEGVLQEVFDYLKKEEFSWEVLIVDDGSTDSTHELIEKFMQGKSNFRLIKNDHGGKAIAVMTGLLESKGNIALFTDMDQATPISEIDKLLAEFERGADIVIGSRSGRKGAPLIRKLMAWGFATLRTLLLGLPFKDTQCGFKAFNRKSIESIFPTLMKSWKQKHATGGAVNAGFDVETLFVAKKKGFKIIEVPVQWHHVGSERVQAISDSIEALLDMLRIRRNEVQGKYN
jgi:dolichyl-phosphate beta-glucosyltransferase